jgi:hypothetical protein
LGCNAMRTQHDAREYGDHEPGHSGHVEHARPRLARR